jgi:hypothetical protein
MNDRPRKLREVPWAERLLLAEALAALAVLRLGQFLVPFRQTVRLLRLAPGESPGALDPAGSALAARVGWAVRAAAARTPWRSACLVQALAALWLLERRGLPATLYLGVAKGPQGPGGLSAHAWLRCGGAIVTGAAGRKRFTPISAFAPRP